MDKDYAAETEQNVRAMQTSRQTERQAKAVEEIQMANTENPEVGTWLH